MWREILLRQAGHSNVSFEDSVKYSIYCFFSAIGVAFADDICQVKEGKSSAIIEDQGAYSSVGTFVHELAHT